MEQGLLPSNVLLWDDIVKATNSKAGQSLLRQGAAQACQTIAAMVFANWQQSEVKYKMLFKELFLENGLTYYFLKQDNEITETTNFSIFQLKPCVLIPSDLHFMVLRRFEELYVNTMNTLAIFLEMSKLGQADKTQQLYDRLFMLYAAEYSAYLTTPDEQLNKQKRKERDELGKLIYKEFEYNIQKMATDLKEALMRCDVKRPTTIKR